MAKKLFGHPRIPKDGELLPGLNRSHGACIGAGSAIYARIRVNMINISFVNSAMGALTQTCSASNAIGFRNFISHFQNTLKSCCKYSNNI
jgi:hypothetical protein